MTCMARNLTELVRRSDEAPLVLELDLTEPLVVDPPTDPLAAMRARKRTRLRDVLDGLARAETDDNVAGVIARLSGRALSLARAQEVRAAVTAFRRSGKPAIACAETFGELAPGSPGYYLATAFGEVWLQESGDLGLTGVAAQATFLHDALDRLGVAMQLGQRHEYKNAADMFVRQGLTDAHREALARLVASAAEQLVGAIAADRRLSPERVRELIDASPLTAAEAREGGLIDHVGYRDQAYDAMRERVGGEMRLRYVGRYRQPPPVVVANRVATRGGVIALIRGSGPIRVGRSGRGPFGGGMGSASVGAAFRVALKDDAVKAIVFRVDSPGGSYVASDSIRREVVLARQAGKPVVVSMGELAASGGYFVSMAADVIVALPATLTGSIGVFGGKAVIERMLSRAGVGSGAVAEGARALMFSARRPYSDDEFATLERWLDRVYEDFTAKVAADRGMSPERVHEIARGRVWTGADAAERGLVDELGGLTDALRIAREKAGLPARTDAADVRVFPRVSPVDRVRPAQSSEDPAAAFAAFAAWDGFGAIAARLGLPGSGPLIMPVPTPL